MAKNNSEETEIKEIRYADVSDRLFAAGMDLGLLYFIVVPLSAIIFPIVFSNGDIVEQAYQMAIAKQPELKEHTDQILSYILNNHPGMFAEIMKQYLIKCLIQIGIIGAFIIPFIHYKGATPGKMLAGIKVVDSITYNKISFSQSIIRFLGYIPSAGVIGMGIFWANFNKQKRGWHDFLADTVVIIDENRWYKRLWKKIVGK